MIMVNAEWYGGLVPNCILYWYEYEYMGNINPRQSDSFFLSFFFFSVFLFIFLFLLKCSAYCTICNLILQLVHHQRCYKIHIHLQAPHSKKTSGQLVLFDSFFRSLNSQNILFCLITHKTFQHFSLCRFFVRTFFSCLFLRFRSPLSSQCIHIRIDVAKQRRT